MGFNLFGKTVVVVGTGQIGTAFCKIMLGFRCKIVAYDVIESKALIGKGVRYITFEKLLEASDIISIHCPLTPKTRHLFDKKAFSKMRPGAMLINTSRGALIKHQMLLMLLKKAFWAIWELMYMKVRKKYSSRTCLLPLSRMISLKGLCHLTMYLLPPSGLFYR